MLDLTSGLGKLRVIDRQALIDGPTHMAQLRISKDFVIRRVTETPGFIALVQECDRGLPDLDHWQTEGDVTHADNSWTMVALYSGDVKCSSATWWNTGNPRHLVERWILPLGATSSRGSQWGAPLWNWLGGKFDRCGYAYDPRLPGRWFRAGWQEMKDAVLCYLAEGRSLSGGTAWRQPASDARSMVYVMREVGSNWIKVGTCKAGSTSPPSRRRSMYQPGNRRDLDIASAWSFTGRNPENAMKAAMRKYCGVAQLRSRSEWFDAGIDEALSQLSIATSHPGISKVDF